MRVSATALLAQLGVTHDVLRFRLTEALSKPFDAEVILITDDPDLPLADLPWTAAIVDLVDQRSGKSRSFHGIVEEAEYLHPREHRHVYRLRLRPFFHGLRYRVQTRIFQDVSTIDIVKRVLLESGLAEDQTSWLTKGEYGTRPYTTQYRESDFAFVSRLLEEEGIFYWFDQSAAGHILCFGDDPSAYAPVEGGGVLPLSKRAELEEEHVTDLVFTTRLHSDVHMTRDWNFETPSKALEAKQEVEEGLGLMRYEYPGGFYNDGQGARRAGDRLQEQLVQRYELRGRSNGWGLAAGRVFGLPNAQPTQLVGDHLLLEVEHSYERGREEEATEGAAAYVTRFRAMPVAPFRPPRTTPKPRVFGKETATVVGPAGEEIHVDAYGRIKVLFYWDRESAPDDTASCWIRFQQMNTAGSMILPRIGWEVTVGFVDGDPDRPVALHKLYNESTMPPYELPANRTQGALQSSSSPGGGGTNEIRMQDGNGSMELFIHAQKDFSQRAGNNAKDETAVDAHETTGTSLLTSVKGDETVSVGGNQSVSVVGSMNDDTGGSLTTNVGAMDEWGVTGNLSVTADGSRTESIGSAMIVIANSVQETFNGSLDRSIGAANVIAAAEGIAEAVGGKKTELVGGAKIELIPKAKAENIGAAKAMNAGAIIYKASDGVNVTAGAAMSIAVAGQIQEKVSGAYSLGASRINYNAAAQATLSAGSTTLEMKGGKLDFKASKLTVKGTAQVQLKCPVLYEHEEEGEE